MTHFRMRTKKKGKQKKPYLVYSGNISGQYIKIEILLKKMPESESEERRVIRTYTPRLIESAIALRATFKKPKYISENLSLERIELLEKLGFTYRQIFKDNYKKELEKYFQEQFKIAHVQGTTQIEGNTCDIIDVYNILKGDLPEGNKKVNEVNEVRNAIKAMEYSRDQIKQNQKISLDFIKELNRLMLLGIEEDAGQFRKGNIFISGYDGQVTPAFLIENELNELLEWYRKNQKKLHPIELSALFHYKFECIHPFNEGNGRVGRELSNFILENRQYPPIVFSPRARKKYINALKECYNDNYLLLIMYFEDMMKSQFYHIIKNLLVLSDSKITSLLGYTPKPKHKILTIDDFLESHQ